MAAKENLHAALPGMEGYEIGERSVPQHRALQQARPVASDKPRAHPDVIHVRIRIEAPVMPEPRSGAGSSRGRREIVRSGAEIFPESLPTRTIVVTASELNQTTPAIAPAIP